MELHARFAWQDAEYAIEKLELSEDPQTVRVMFAASVVLLRTIGDVLDKVDKINSPEYVKKTIDDQWQSIKGASRPNLFFDFIKLHRDQVVHNYEIEPELFDSPIVAMSGEMSFGPFLVDTFLLNSGPYEGCDARDLARESLDWWDGELTGIEEAVQ